jgi:hypothetical protein
MPRPEGARRSRQESCWDRCAGRRLVLVFGTVKECHKKAKVSLCIREGVALLGKSASIGQAPWSLALAQKFILRR